MSRREMADVYEAGGGQWDAPVDLARCRASVWVRDARESHQCRRRAVVEAEGLGWCRQHSPAAVAERRDRRDGAWEALKRQWNAEAVGRAWVGEMRRSGDAERAHAAALRAWDAAAWNRPAEGR